MVVDVANILQLIDFKKLLRWDFMHFLIFKQKKRNIAINWTLCYLNKFNTYYLLSICALKLEIIDFHELQKIASRIEENTHALDSWDESSPEQRKALEKILFFGVSAEQCVHYEQHNSPSPKPILVDEEDEEERQKRRFSL